MNPVRLDAIAAAHALLRLNIYANERLAAAGPLRAPMLRIKDLGKASPWVDADAPENALNGLPRRCVEAAERLLAMVRQADPVDPRYVALVLQTVAGDAQKFSQGARRFALAHGVTLDERVRDELGYHEVMREVGHHADRIGGLS